MRIDNNNTANTPVGQTTRTAETQAADSAAKGARTSSSPSASDGLQLSQFGGKVSSIIQSDSANRSQRVAQLATAVKSGTYQVDAAAVSRAIVDQTISPGQSS